MADVLNDTKIKQGDPVPMTFRQWYIQDRDKAAAWKEEAREDFEFVAGRAYTDEERKKLAAKRRPVVEFNRVGPVVDAITGYEIGNRREVRYIPREMGDVQANEMLTAAAQWFRDEGYADFADSSMFASVVICGMGWTETRLDFSQGPSPKPIVEEIDPMEMAWDRDARQRNLRDARRVWRVRRLPIAEAESMFPNYDKGQLDATWTQVNSEADLYRDDEPTSVAEDGYVTIAQCQWVEKETYYVAQDPFTGEETEFTAAEWGQANKRLKALTGMEMQGARFRRKVRKQAFMGEVVLSYGPAPCNDQFSLQCVTGKFDRNKGTWYGVVRAMKDPQRWANKWLAQMMHIMNSNAKGGIMAEKGAFADPRKAQAEWSSPDSVTLMEDGAISNNKVKEKPQTQFPVALQQLTEFAIQSIRDVSGVSVEFLGMRESDQPASLEYQRRQAGMNILQWAFDGMKLYRELQGEVVLYYLQTDVPEGTLIRIAGEENEQYVPLIHEASKDFDIIVDDAPTAPNQKELIWSVISSLIPMIGKVIPPEYILKALKYSPLPASVVAELEEMAKAPNPQAQEQAAMAARAAAAEIEKTESETQLNLAKAASEGGSGQIEQVKAAAQMENDQRDFTMQMASRQADQQMAREKHAMDMEKAEIGLAAAIAKATQPKPQPATN
jgi:hypothetical protein